MLSIKLVRIGKKNLPAFRVAVGEGQKVTEFIGHYYPHSVAKKFQIDKERLAHWQKSGAQLTAAVAALLKGKYEFKKYVPKPAEAESPAVTAKTEGTEAKPEEPSSSPEEKREEGAETAPAEESQTKDA